MIFRKERKDFSRDSNDITARQVCCILKSHQVIKISWKLPYFSIQFLSHIHTDMVEKKKSLFMAKREQFMAWDEQKFLSLSLICSLHMFISIEICSWKAYPSHMLVDSALLYNNTMKVYLFSREILISFKTWRFVLSSYLSLSLFSLKLSKSSSSYH